MSGTAYNVWGLNRLNTTKMVSMALADISGCPSTSGSKDVIECMRNLDGSVIVANQLLTFVSRTDSAMKTQLKIHGQCLSKRNKYFCFNASRQPASSFLI